MKRFFGRKAFKPTPIQPRNHWDPSSIHPTVLDISSANSHDPTSPDLDTILSQLAAILQDKGEYRNLVSQRGELAQSLLDLLQSLSTSPQASSRLRSSILKAVLTLSRKSSLYPQCLTIGNVKQHGEHPVTSGGFGEIWKGEIDGSQEIVCLKVVKLYQRSNTEKVLKNFVREAIVWRQLEHPNLLPFLGLYFLDTSKQQLCLISPWMDDGNLIQFLERTPRGEVNHQQLAWDVSSGLQYLHQAKIVHADLKGVNILITKDGRATVGDFGLSHVADGEVFRMTSSSAFQGGSLRWLAPELLDPKLLGPEPQPSYESDIYAFGCVCYEIYTGLRPFHDLRNEAAVMLQVIQGNRPSRPDNLPELDDGVWTVIQQCWASDASSRPNISKIQEQFLLVFGVVEPAPSWGSTVSKQIWANAKSNDMSSYGFRAFDFLTQSYENLRRRTLGLSDVVVEDAVLSELEFCISPRNLSPNSFSDGEDPSAHQYSIDKLTAPGGHLRAISEEYWVKPPGKDAQLSLQINAECGTEDSSDYAHTGRRTAFLFTPSLLLDDKTYRLSKLPAMETGSSLKCSSIQNGDGERDEYPDAMNSYHDTPSDSVQRGDVQLVNIPFIANQLKEKGTDAFSSSGSTTSPNLPLTETNSHYLDQDRSPECRGRPRCVRSLALRDCTLPLEEDIRRISEECQTGISNASSLTEVLSAVTPEEVFNDSERRIKDLRRKCVASREFIAGQIPWASVGAERSRREVETDVDSDTQTTEERLLADLLEANEKLNSAMHQHVHLRRVALESKIGMAIFVGQIE